MSIFKNTGNNDNIKVNFNDKERFQFPEDVVEMIYNIDSCNITSVKKYKPNNNYDKSEFHRFDYAFIRNLRITTLNEKKTVSFTYKSKNVILHEIPELCDKYDVQAIPELIQRKLREIVQRSQNPGQNYSQCEK